MPTEPSSTAALEAARKLAERVGAGERSAISQALNAVDDNRASSR